MRTRSRNTLVAALLCGVLGIPAASVSAACPAVEPFGPGLFSTTSQWEWRITFSPLRQQAFWTVSDDFFPVTRQSTIVQSRRSLLGWQAATTASFSGTYTDIDPFIAPDGLTLYFSSIRPVDGVARTDLDLWMVKRTSWDSWGEPVHLGLANSPGDELYPSIDLWGNLYFGSDRDGQFDIYRSQRRHDGTFGPAQRIGDGVNTAAYWEFNPEISPDGRTLLFTSLYRPDGYGYGDLYVSHVRNGQFTPARNLGACVNTAGDEYHPTVLWLERKLVFVRNPVLPGTNGDFMITPLRLPPAQ